MNSYCQQDSGKKYSVVKMAILLFLPLVFLCQMVLLFGAYVLSYHGVLVISDSRNLEPDEQRSVPSEKKNGNNVMLTSCGTEDLGVAVAEVRTSVVYISGHRTSPSGVSSSRGAISFSPEILTSDKMGSGIIFDPVGYILTNFHVIADISDMHVRIFGDHQNSYPSETIITDPKRDLAVIKINPSFSLPTAKLGNSDMLEIGDNVLTVGCPFNLEQSVTHGVVSDVKRTVTIDERVYNDLIQTDAAINSGNSGGALINENGEVVGINVAIYAPNKVYCGVGFAIPINHAKLLMMKVQYDEAGKEG